MVYVGTTVVFFFVVNNVKPVPCGRLGQFSADNLAISLVLAPLAMLGVWLGMRLHRPVGHALFYRICYGMLFLTGLNLLSNSLGPYLQ